MLELGKIVSTSNFAATRPLAFSRFASYSPQLASSVDRSAGLTWPVNATPLWKQFLAVGGAGAATDTLRGEMDVLVSRLGSDVSIESVEATGSQGAARAKYRVYSTEARQRGGMHRRSNAT